MPTTFLQVADNAKLTLPTDSLNNTDASITIGDIDNTLFPQFITGYIVTIWDANNYPDPGDDPNVEKATVTAATIGANGSFTLTRSQPKEHSGNPRLALLVLARHVDDITDAINTLETVITDKADITYVNTAVASKTDTAYVDTAIANLIDGAPGALNTLNELAAAFGDDPTFAATVTTQLGLKASKAELAAAAATAETLTNKTISGTNNTITNIAVNALSTTGTANSLTYLRGDGAWTEITGGGGGGSGLTDIEGGTPSSVYGGITTIDGGSV